MKDLNKYNTAIKIVSLNINDRNELIDILRKHNIKSINNKEINFLEFNKDLQLYNFVKMTSKIPVDLKTFKQIHFNYDKK